MTSDIIYDIEAYPNIFTISFVDPETNRDITFEMSEWKDDWLDFLEFFKKCQSSFIRWVGFNNFGYDYQVLHRLINHQEFISMKDKSGFAFRLSDKIINMSREEKFRHTVWQHEHLIPQIDLFKIHHFDNIARSTSLKKLEFNMRSHSIQDLPYPVGSILTREQADKLIRYNIHDCRETVKFYEKTKDMIAFREVLTKRYDKNFMNHNDTKIGKDYFIMELEKADIRCFKKVDGEKVPVQTKRQFIDINDIIYPYVSFKRPEFNAVVDWLRKQKIRETNGVFTEIDDLGELEKYANLKKKKGKVKNLNCIVDGFQFDFGTGGIHGSLESTIVQSDDNYAIIDYDVTSLYPSIAIENGNYPEHLTSKFCEIYKDMRAQRVSHAKGTPENAMLKLALNGVYGDSNNKFSCFYDPQYTMTITINGQLMLCMLAEKLMGIDSLSLIQINTDGVTIKVLRDKIEEVEKINKEWEKLTKLQLERADYDKMFIMNVNKYIGLYLDGTMKRKGAYEYDVKKKGWHQNMSAVVVAKAAEANLIHGVNITDFIMNHDNKMDFMLRTNVPRNFSLLYEFDDHYEKLQNVTRYYISNEGGSLAKIMPKQGKTHEAIYATMEKTRQFKKLELLKARHRKLELNNDERISNINDKYKVTIMNTMGEVTDINYKWYILEAHKLVDPLWNGLYNDLIS